MSPIDPDRSGSRGSREVMLDTTENTSRLPDYMLHHHVKTNFVKNNIVVNKLIEEFRNRVALLLQIPTNHILISIPHMCDGCIPFSNRALVIGILSANSRVKYRVTCWRMWNGLYFGRLRDTSFRTPRMLHQ